MMASYVNVNYCVMRRKNTFVDLKQKIFSFANCIRKIRASDTDVAFLFLDSSRVRCGGIVAKVGCQPFFCFAKRHAFAFGK